MHGDGVIAIPVVHPVLDHFAGDAAKIRHTMPVVKKNWNHSQVIAIRYLQRDLEICGDSLLARRIRAGIGIEGEPKTDGVNAGKVFPSLAQFSMKEFRLELPPDDKPTGTPARLVIETANVPVGIRGRSRILGLAERLVSRESNIRS